jgi:transglutaminase-like putative cysteine protease
VTGRSRLVGATLLACLGACAPFGALFAGWAWLPPLVVAVAVVIGVNELVRRSPLPSAVGPLAAAVAMVLVISAMDAHRQAIAGFLPGAAARAHLSTLLHLGATVAHTKASPVPASTGVVLLAVIGIAAVTLVVDLFALTLDRPAFAGPALLAVYVIDSLLTHHGVGWRPFLLCVGGYLLLLAADTGEARRRWGRRFSDAAARPAWAGNGGRIGGTALAIALVVPVVLPGLSADLPKPTGGGSGGGGAAGGGGVVTLNPVVALSNELHRDSNEVLITYRTQAASPGYLRLTALDAFNGDAFSAGQLRAGSSRPVDGISPLTTGGGHSDRRTQLHVGPLLEHWAPVPLRPTVADIPGNWMYEPATQTVWSAQSTTRGLTYDVRSDSRVPTASQLGAVSYDQLSPRPAGVPATDVGVPQAVSSRVYGLAAQLERSTPYRTALAIQAHFLSGPFTYDLDVPASDSAGALDAFLFRTHLGFCQQYAAAMTLLARIDGIPARVAVGFTPGSKGHDGYWTVTGGDAHAWPELYFPGVGWVPFEPTPRADGQTKAPPYATARALHGRGVSPIDKSKLHRHKAAPGHSKPSKAAAHHHAAGVPEAPTATTTARDVVPASTILLGLLALAALAVAVPAAVRLTNRRRHLHPHGSAAAAHAAWDELRESIIDLGIDWPADRTPRQTVAHLLRCVPSLATVGVPLGRIGLAEQQARYAPVVDTALGAGLASDVGAVRAALFARAGRVERWRATLLPRSSLQAVSRRAGALSTWRPRSAGSRGRAARIWRAVPRVSTGRR